MIRKAIIISLAALIISRCNNSDGDKMTTDKTMSFKQSELADSIVRIEMNLSAFGVESDDFPSINVLIDFTHDTSSCVKYFYNPAYKGSTYSLTKNEIIEVKKLLKISDLEKLG